MAHTSATEILFCGTAAAEAWPALFCTCEACARARERGGKDVRARAAYMLGDRVRIDFGPDSCAQMHRFGLAYERLEHLLVTHSHDDHWFPRDLTYRRKGFSVAPSEPLHIWGNAKVAAKFEATGHGWEECGLAFHRVAPWERVDLGGGLGAIPVLAAHDRSEECVNYVLDLAGRAALVGHDTGWYDEAAWEFLGRRPLSLVILDCTYGSMDESRGHLGSPSVVRARDELAKRGALADGARVVATHFSHNGGWLHEDLERYFAPHGIEVGYDGLRLLL